VLESFLDVRLFHRKREGIILTEVGEEYYRAIAPAFATISATTDRIKRAQDSTPLIVRAPATFAVRFLIPGLRDFRREHPGLNVRIVTGFGPVDFMREDVDISIQAGFGEWPCTESKMLFANWIQPMCGPKLFKDGPPIRCIDDLLSYRLLTSSNRPADWVNWVTAVGRPDFPLDRMEIIQFPISMLAYDAAADGLGVVIAQLPVAEFGGQGLIRLCGKPVRQGAYYATWRAKIEPSRKTRHFLSWLRREIEPALARVDQIPDPVRCRGHVDVEDVELAESIDDGADDGGWRRGGSALAPGFDAQGVGGRQHLGDVGRK
jgi:LysR family transcriptional regulator, glycine cleavage system transcriptional activator